MFEGARIFDLYRNAERPPAVTQLEALDDVKRRRVRACDNCRCRCRRKSAIVSTTSVSPAFIMADGLPVGAYFSDAPNAETSRRTRRTSGPPSLIKMTSFLPCTKI